MEFLQPKSSDLDANFHTSAYKVKASVHGSKLKRNEPTSLDEKSVGGLGSGVKKDSAQLSVSLIDLEIDSQDKKDGYDSSNSNSFYDSSSKSFYDASYNHLPSKKYLTYGMSISHDSCLVGPEFSKQPDILEEDDALNFGGQSAS